MTASCEIGMMDAAHNTAETIENKLGEGHPSWWWNFMSCGATYSCSSVYRDIISFIYILKKIGTSSLSQFRAS
jgi:hypothetical protein